MTGSETRSADRDLVRAIRLGLEDFSKEVDDEFGRLLPGLIDAGYVETSGHSPTGYFWAFTESGVKRGDELGAWDD